MSSDQITSRKVAEEALVQKAAKDGAFRKQLLTDPKVAISNALGIRLPADVRISVLEETSKHLYLVLPARTEKGELAEIELAAVAGGKADPTKWG